MQILLSAIRASGDYRLRDYVWASIVTALLPAVIAGLVMWLVPAGCDIRGDASVYRWTCLLPGLLIVVPAAVGLCLPIAMYLNRHLGHRFPDGWLATILAVGFFTQLVLVGAYLLFLEPAYRRLMLWEIALIPQPFVAGAISGGVYWATLNLRACGRASNTMVDGQPDDS